MEKREVFGVFVAEKRRTAGLSQRGLADLLHVTESAVSKWERGVSYPDITMISPLSSALGISDHELMNASDDHEFAHISTQASRFRAQRAIVTWGSAIIYGIALVTCFIVNLAVDHSLTWFFIVLTSLMVAASLTVVPYWVGKRPWLVVLGAFLVSLFLLFFVSWLYTGGGWWIAVAIVSTLFGCTLAFGPLILRSLEPVGWLGDNKALVCIAVDTVFLLPLVGVSMLASGTQAQFVTVALPIILASVAPVWGMLLVIRYLPISGWYRAAICAVLAAGLFFLNPIISTVVDGGPLSLWRRFDFFDWSTSELINNNIGFITTFAFLAVAAVLAAIGLASQRVRARDAIGSHGE